MHCRQFFLIIIIIDFSISLWNDLVDPVFDGVGLAGFKSRANAFLFPKVARSFFVFYCFHFLYSLWVDIVGLGSADEQGLWVDIVGLGSADGQGLWVNIVGLGSADGQGLNRSLSALHC